MNNKKHKFTIKLNNLLILFFLSILIYLNYNKLISNNIHTKNANINYKKIKISEQKEKKVPHNQSLPAQIENFQVVDTIVNVYKSPLINSEVVTQALYGESVKVFTQNQSWAKISLPEQFNYQGWIQISALKPIVQTQDWSNQKIVNVPKVDILIKPDKEAEVLLQLPLGAIISAKSSKIINNFIAVKLIDERQGYIVATSLSDYHKNNASKVSQHSILKIANQLLNQPYLWGGMTTGGIDCSGFIHTVFKVNGIHLHRDTDIQYLKDGIFVDQTALQSGDLIFFETSKPGASHVGIYAGNRKFIHASNRGVNYDSLDNSYYSKRFVGAKRIINSVN